MRSVYAAFLCVALAAPLFAQSLTASDPAVRTAIAHLKSEAGGLGLASADVADLALSSAHTNARTGLSYVYIQQRIDGIDVAEALVTVAIGSDGRVLHTAGDLVAGTTSASKAASLTADAALVSAARAVGVALPAFPPRRTEPGAARYTRFGEIGGDEVSARLIYAREDALRLAWEVLLPTPDGSHYWVVRLDAATGREISRHDLVVHDTFGSTTASFAPLSTPSALSFVQPRIANSLVGTYNVFALPDESPQHGTIVPPADGRQSIANPDDATYSPFGWHDTNGAAGAEFTTTQGNNVHAYTDTDANNVPDTGSSPDGGAGLSFNFPLDLTQAPSTYRPAAVVNLFYWNNVVHDVMAHYGFDSPGGNFQTNTYGAGGTGNDYVQAEAQDGSGDCNANFSTPADGSRPRMQMFTCTNASPSRDGDFDNGVIVHEYGHGISNRLTGGPAAVACLQNAEQQGEGWSDFYALAFSAKPGDTRTDARGIGTYLFGQAANGPGIRLAPYSTDFSVNNYTYERTKYMSAVHQIGFVWATALWEMYWDLVDAHGFSPDLYTNGTAGNQIAINLVTQGMKLQPCSPGFVSSRDAIIAADAALYPTGTPGQGQHFALLWNAFARRGLGSSANQGSTSSNADNVEAFNTPLASPSLSYAPGSLSFSLLTGETDSKPIVVQNGASAGSSHLNVSASVTNITPLAPLGDLPIAHAKASPSGPRPTGSIQVHGTPEAARATTPDGPALPLEGVRTQSAPSIPGDALIPVTCANGANIQQFTANFFTVVTSGAQELGQSFQAPCSGQLTQVLPVINAAGAPSASWGATMRVYAGAGTGGTQLTAAAFTFTNPASGAFLLTIPVGPIDVVAGQNYTWFMDMTSNSTGMQYASSDVIGFGQRYRTTNGNPASAVASTGDMQYQANFGPPDTWIAVDPQISSAAPGGMSILNVDVDATGLANGVYTADIQVTTNDPGSSSVTIPVTLTVGAAAGSATMDGDPGWFLMGSPTANTTVDQLATQNLVAGVPGYYPTFSGGPPATPTLYTSYNGASWVPSTGTGETIASGQGFLWYFWDAAFTPAEPTTFASSAVAFPTTLTAPGAVNASNASRVLHTAGNRINALGNPFGTALNLTGIQSWPGGNRVASKGRAFVWDPVLNAWYFGAAAASVEPWQGFAVRSKTAGGTLTIPASAAAFTGKADLASDRRRIEFALDGTETGTGRALADRSLEVSFEADATDGWDEADAEKLAPLADAFVSIGVAATASGETVLKAGESRAFEPTSFEVPLAVETAGAESALTLRWPVLNDLPATWRVSLRDLATGEEIDLRQTESYTFEATPRARKARDESPRLADADPSGSTLRFVLSVETGIAAQIEAGPAFGLEAVVPNPVRGTAAVTFALAEASETTLAVYDVQGREVAVLASGRLEAGRHEVAWPTGDLAPGVYVVRLRAGSELATRRAVVVR